MNKKTVAVLTLRVEYEDLDSLEEIKELVEEARSYGVVSKAELVVPKEVVVNLLR